ncbi:unnamed protein product [Caenorhabditis auriculariae]|uniref:STAS domain-containing protein n=1 Tax=Caenorhabditis auriculariae TaxID=2777116 RepID=A0A8S1GN95_9PELO|nr:unnamed protein product [Caenorhabditis auriculariae]
MQRLNSREDSSAFFDVLPTRSTQSISPKDVTDKKEDVMDLSSLMESPINSVYQRRSPNVRANMNKMKSKDIIDQQLFDNTYGFRRLNLSFGERVHWHYRKMVRWKRPEWLQFVTSRAPASRWLPSYSWRSDFFADALGGVMVSVITVPQSLAYGYLVGVPPANGLASNIIGPLIYAVLGSSKHASPGSFAIVALMVGAAVERYSHPQSLVEASMEEIVCCHEKKSRTDEHIAIGIATSITLLVGLIQIVLGMMNAGLLAVWLSDHLVQGLTTGAAIHVLTSQLKTMTGVKEVPPTSEPRMLIQVWEKANKKLDSIHLTSTIISVVSVVFLLLSAYVIDPILRKWSKFKFPMELLLVIFSTLLVYLSQDTEYEINVPIVGAVEPGLPAPLIPPMPNFINMIGAAVSIGIVSFVVHIAMCKLVAKKLNYEIDSNQEWLALGVMHAVSSFFGCYAGGSSLGRTMMQVKCGAKSQMSTICCCAVIVVFTFGAAQFIYYLPKPVLASIVVVAMKDLFLQIFSAFSVSRRSMFDFLIFVVTLSAVVLLNVSYGLVVGVAFALLTVIFRTQWADSTVLGRIPGTSHFRGMGHYTKATEVPGVKIFRFDSPVYFATSELFLSRVHTLCVNPVLVRAKLNEQEKKKKQEKMKNSARSDVTPVGSTLKINAKPDRSEAMPEDGEEHEITEITHIIVDCSSIPFVDLMGKDALMQTYLEYQAIDIAVLFANTKEKVRQMLEATDFFTKVPDNRVFVSISDAVNQAHWEQHNKYPPNLPSDRAQRPPEEKQPIAKSVAQKTAPLSVQATQSLASVLTPTDGSFGEKAAFAQSLTAKAPSQNRVRKEDNKNKRHPAENRRRHIQLSHATSKTSLLQDEDKTQ